MAKALTLQAFALTGRLVFSGMLTKQPYSLNKFLTHI